MRPSAPRGPSTGNPDFVRPHSPSGIKSIYVHVLLTTLHKETCFIHAIPSGAPLFKRQAGGDAGFFLFLSFFFKQKLSRLRKKSLLRFVFSSRTGCEEALLSF